jgi:hypothetical protein
MEKRLRQNKSAVGPSEWFAWLLSDGGSIAPVIQVVLRKETNLNIVKFL